MRRFIRREARARIRRRCKVKQVEVEGRRYIVCLNLEQAEKDRRDREAIVAALENALQRGDKSLVGNKGYRTYLKAPAEGFTIDEEKVRRRRRATTASGCCARTRICPPARWR